MICCRHSSLVVASVRIRQTPIAQGRDGLIAPVIALTGAKGLALFMDIDEQNSSTSFPLRTCAH